MINGDANSTLFCSDCGNLKMKTNMYAYCSRCEKLVYSLNNYTVHKPPIMKPAGLAIAILGLECPEILLIHYNQHASTSQIFIKNEHCIPAHIRNLKEKYLRLEYFDAITELLEPNEIVNIKGNHTERQNVRTAVLSHIKNIFYADIVEMKQVNPLIQGDFKEVFNRCQVRVINAIENFMGYSGNIYYCTECESIGDRELLLPKGRSQLQKCAECS